MNGCIVQKNIENVMDDDVLVATDKKQHILVCNDG